MPDEPVKVRIIPPDIKSLTEEEFETAMDNAFCAPKYECSICGSRTGCDHAHVSPAVLKPVDQAVLISPTEYRRILWTLVEERTRVGQLRHWLANAGANMKKPQLELKVMMEAVETALLVDEPQGVLSEAMNEVSLSMAGKLNLDLPKWVQRHLDAVNGLEIGGMKPFGSVPRLDSLKGTAVEVAPRQGLRGPAIDDLTTGKPLDLNAVMRVEPNEGDPYCPVCGIAFCTTHPQPTKE